MPEFSLCWNAPMCPRGKDCDRNARYHKRQKHQSFFSPKYNDNGCEWFKDRSMDGHTSDAGSNGS